MEKRAQVLRNYLDNPSIANRNALISEHRPLIYWVVRRMCRIPLELVPDAFQEGVMGLCTAIERFDPAKGEFGSYAIIRIRAAVELWMEREVRQSRCTTISRTARRSCSSVESRAVNSESRRAFKGVRGQHDDESVFDLIDTIADDSPSPQEQTITQVTRDTVRAHLARLHFSEREAAVVHDHLEEGVSLAVLGERFGISKQRFSQIKTQVVGRLSALKELA